MVYIKFDVGSHAKGYATSASDNDYVIVTKCSEEDFMLFLDNRNKLVNRHKNEDGCDCTYVDLFNALMGIYKGNFYYLGVFAKKEDFVDKNGIDNNELFTFVRELSTLRMPAIAKTMCLNYNIKKMKTKHAARKEDFKNSPSNPKNLLAAMHNMAYVQRWLRLRKYVEHEPLPQLLGLNKERRAMYESLMEKRNSQTPATDEEIQFMEDWQENLYQQLSHIPDLPERYDVRKVIALYMMNERGPIMPLQRHITKLLYMSIQQLSRSVSGPLWRQVVHVQEKLDGCNFRIIVDKGVITYGSKNTYRVLDDFMGYHAIRTQLEACARRLAVILKSNSFVVYGELVGWRDDERTKPLNDISYVGQREKLKYYAYEIVCCSEPELDEECTTEDVEFTLTQQLLEQAQFDIIPYESCQFETFAGSEIKYRSLLFPEHGEELVEGYILRCNGLKFKVKKEYDLKSLSESNATNVLTKEFIEQAVSWPVNENNFTEAAMLCYKAVLPYNETNPLPPSKIFGKIFGMLCEQSNLLHKSFKTKLNEFLSAVNNNSV
ncbi:HE-65 [Mythimna sequax nucleopolyhedrovirus]|nr:HE-65 [Mythimna sequax nucleopolyhedrovirus]